MLINNNVGITPKASNDLQRFYFCFKHDNQVNDNIGTFLPDLIPEFHSDQIFMKANQKNPDSGKGIARKFINRLAEKRNQQMMTQLNELFIEKLKTIYWLEKQLLKSIPRVIKNARSVELINAMEIHLTVTMDQVRRLEAVFETIGEEYGIQKSEAAAALMKEMENVIKITGEAIVRDAGIILAMQQIQHYNIALYGTLCSYAKTLDAEEAAAVLASALEEEKESDKDLTQIAETFINPVAARGYNPDNKVLFPQIQFIQQSPINKLNLFYS